MLNGVAQKKGLNRLKNSQMQLNILDKVFLVFQFIKIPGRTADVISGERSQGDVLLDIGEIIEHRENF